MGGILENVRRVFQPAREYMPQAAMTFEKVESDKRSVPQTTAHRTHLSGIDLWISIGAGLGSAGITTYLLWRHRREVPEWRSPVAVDLTERLGTLDLPLTDDARAILEGFGRGRLPHVILAGPSGSGKSHSLDAALAAIVQGRSGVEAFEGQKLGVSRINVAALINQTRGWLNRSEDLFLRTLDSLRGNPRVLHLTEADQMAEANLLPRLYAVMENPEYRNLFLVLETTRWPIFVSDAPDLIKRTGFVELRPNPSDHFNADHFAEEIRSRYPGLASERYWRGENSLGRSMANRAFHGWLEDGAPLVTVGSLKLPAEAYIESAVTELLRSAERSTSAGAAALRTALAREEADRGRRERRGIDDLPEALREAGRRAMEISARR